MRHILRRSRQRLFLQANNLTPGSMSELYKSEKIKVSEEHRGFICCHSKRWWLTGMFDMWREVVKGAAAFTYWRKNLNYLNK